MENDYWIKELFKIFSRKGLFEREDFELEKEVRPQWHLNRKDLEKISLVSIVDIAGNEASDDDLKEAFCRKIIESYNSPNDFLEELYYEQFHRGISGPHGNFVGRGNLYIFKRLLKRREIRSGKEFALNGIIIDYNSRGENLSLNTTFGKDFGISFYEPTDFLGKLLDFNENIAISREPEKIINGLVETISKLIK